MLCAVALCKFLSHLACTKYIVYCVTVPISDTRFVSCVLGCASSVFWCCSCVMCVVVSSVVVDHPSRAANEGWPMYTLVLPIYICNTEPFSCAYIPPMCDTPNNRAKVCVSGHLRSHPMCTPPTTDTESVPNPSGILQNIRRVDHQHNFICPTTICFFVLALCICCDQYVDGAEVVARVDASLIVLFISRPFIR